jgi:hypothetical protein
LLMTVAVAFTIRKVSRRWTKSMSDLSVVWMFPRFKPHLCRKCWGPFLQ